MGYNANARKQVLEELEQYGTPRDGSGRAMALLITRMRKHGYKVPSQAALAQLINRMVRDGQLEVERNSKRTYSIALAKPLQVQMVDHIPAPAIQAQPEQPQLERTYDFDTQRKIAKLERQLEHERDRNKSKDAVIHGQKLRIQQLERNLQAVLDSDYVSDERFREIRQIMSTVPGFDKYNDKKAPKKVFN